MPWFVVPLILEATPVVQYSDIDRGQRILFCRSYFTYFSTCSHVEVLTLVCKLRDLPFTLAQCNNTIEVPIIMNLLIILYLVLLWRHVADRKQTGSEYNVWGGKRH